MKAPILLSAFLAMHASAVVVPRNDGMSDQEILRAFLENPSLLPPSMYTVLEGHAKKALTKRSPQWSLGPLSGVSALNPATIATFMGTLDAMLVSLAPVNANAPKSTVPEYQPQPQSPEWPGSKRAKIRYGPYRIPPTSERNFDSELLKVQGMANTFKFGATRPCQGDCKILTLLASLEFADGSHAENQQGAWFHHAVLFNTGPKANTANCGPLPLENIFMAGNEKSNVIFGLQNSTIKSGYPLTQPDKFILSTQLMNLENKEKWVWITITYDYVDTDQSKYKDGRNMWMSLSPFTAGACPGNMTNPFGESNLTSTLQPKKNVFSEHSLPWIAPSDGFILATGGHMHDGGTSTDIFLNDKVICTSTPKYGKGQSEHGGMDGMGSGEGGGASSNAEIPHIQGQNRCTFPNGIPLKKGDRMYISANYDFMKHQGMRNKKEELDSVMGIVGTLVAV